MIKALPFILRDFIAINLIFTIIGGYFFCQMGSYFIPVFFWLKFIGFGIVWFGRIYSNNRLYFYYNLGISKVKLLAASFIIDLLFGITTLLVLNGIA